MYVAQKISWQTNLIYPCVPSYSTPLWSNLEEEKKGSENDSSVKTSQLDSEIRREWLN